MNPLSKHSSKFRQQDLLVFSRDKFLVHKKYLPRQISVGLCGTKSSEV